MPTTITVETCARCPFVGSGIPHCNAPDFDIPGRRPSSIVVEKSVGWVGKKGPPPKTCPLRSGAVVVRIGGGK